LLHNSRIIALLVFFLVGVLGFISVDKGLPSDTPPPAQYSAADTPRLEVSRFRGHLQLSGHTTSLRHENELLRTAAAIAPGSQPSTDFKPLGTAPDFWAPASIAVLEALAETISGKAQFSGNRLQIRGVSTAAWPETERRLRAALPESVDPDIEMIITDGSIRSRDICARAFEDYQTGAINFEESTTVFRDSARLALDRALSMANACRSSVIVVTGHTDATGPETWNQHLSLARATAVAEYLAKGGVAVERLRTNGAGSSVPLASNDSRYGRGLNRRIEIEFQPAY
jgi:outer membrane protein OmpA-like peptidoglycan-associated protein